MSKNKIVTVIGGSGFLGKYVVSTLAKAGYRIRIAVRNQNTAHDLIVNGYVGQISCVQCNVRNYQSIKRVTRDADYVINCVGILYESGNQSFLETQAQGAKNIALACKENNVEKLVHVSAIGADPSSSSDYAVSKALAESSVLEILPNSTIIRPSIIFGHEDNFFNLFAKFALYSPVLPLIGGGQSRFQPVYVGDVAQAIVKSLNFSEVDGKILELGGTQILTFKQVLEKILFEIGKKRLFVPVPFWLAKIKAFFLQFLPNPLLTPDQVELLKSDNVVHSDRDGFKMLDLTPTDLDVILPSYLYSYRKAAPYDFSRGFGYKSQKKA